MPRVAGQEIEMNKSYQNLLADVDEMDFLAILNYAYLHIKDRAEEFNGPTRAKYERRRELIKDLSLEFLQKIGDEK